MTMNGNVVEFNGITKLNIPPDRMLEKATGKLETVLILGVTKNGSEYFASSVADAAEAIFMMERAKHALMKIVDEMTDE